MNTIKMTSFNNAEKNVFSQGSCVFSDDKEPEMEVDQLSPVFDNDDEEVCEDLDSWIGSEDDEDVFSENEYISDYSSDSEEEFYEEDEELIEKMKKEVEREKALKQMEGLAIIRDKLNWLEKVPDIETSGTTSAKFDENSFCGQDSKNFPALELGVKNDNFNKRVVSKVSGGFLLPSNSTIQVFIRDRTFIEFGEIRCKLFSEGLCTKGSACEYTHYKPRPFLQKRGLYENRVCRFVQQGQVCKYTNCKFSHDINTSGKNQEYDVDVDTSHVSKRRQEYKGAYEPLKNKNSFYHPETEDQTEESKNNKSSPVRPRSPVTPTEDKKFLLCRNMFKVDGKAISEIGCCKFGNNCIFAHSWTEVRDRISQSPGNFYCKHETANKRCKGVFVIKLARTDSKGVVRNIIKYKNNPDFKCSKIHKTERVKDFIIRTQSVVTLESHIPN